MRRILVFAIAACGPAHVAPTPAPLPVRAPAPAAKLPETPVENADVTPRAYRLELAIDPEAAGYTGTISIDLTLASRTDQIWLDDDGPRVDEAHLTVGGETLELVPISPAPVGRIGYALSHPVDPGDARLDLSFAADYRTEDGVFAQTYRTHSYVFSDLEPTDARRAFPCFDEPRWKTPWTVSLVVPAADLALSNTSPTSTTPLDGGLARVAFATTAPLPSYLVALAVGPFDTVDAPGGPVPMRIIVPAGRTEAAARAAAFAPGLAIVAKSFLDREVPFDKIDLIAVPRFGGAMENPGLITVAGDTLLDGHGDKDDRRLALILAHELSHLWFGDSVTLVDWRDLWINEGVASWMADEVLARWRPDWATGRDELHARDEAMSDDDVAGVHPLRPDALDVPRQLFDVLTYQKGAAILHMLEGWVGGDRLVDVLRGYLDAHAGGSASSADLIDALAPLGDDVASVMTPFVTTAGVPTVDARLECHGRARLHLQAEGGWRVPVCARWSDGTPHRACLVVGGPTELALGDTCPTWVTPDADASGYYRWTLSGAPLAAVIAGEGADDRERLDATLAIPRTLAAGASLRDVAAALRAATASGIPEVVDAAATDYRLLLQDLAPPGARRAIAAHLRAGLAPTLRRLGNEPRAGEPDDDARLRAIALTAAGTLGGDRRVIAWAKKRTRGWLRDRAHDPDLLEPALLVAGAHADARLAEQLLHAAAGAVDDPSDDDGDGAVLARALGRMPRKRALRALDAALAGEVPSVVTFALAIELLGRGDTAHAAARALAHKGDWLAVTMTFASTCDPAIVDHLVASGAAGDDPGYARSLARRRVEAARCAALRPRAAGAARAFR